MTNTVSALAGEPIAGVLDQLYEKANAARPSAQGSSARRHHPGMSPQERADAMSDVYMTISPATGRMLYSLVRAARPSTVVEFGMSFGLSTLYLAAAVRDNGFGHIHTTEMSTAKIAAATATFAEAGVADLISVLDGDALTTLPTVPGDIDFVVLDGWKELYLPVVNLLEDRLVPGTLLVADNADSPDLTPYLDHVRDPANGYTSVNLPGKDNDTVELSCRT